MLHNVLSQGRFWAAGLALVVAVGVFVASAQAKRDGDTKVRDKRTVRVSNMEGKGYLGVRMQELTDEMRKGLNVRADHGVLVSDVIAESPAKEAGLEEGDIIIRFNGKKVESPEQLRELVADTEAGDDVEVEIVRDERQKTLHVTIAEWPENGYSFSMDDFDWEDMPRFVHAFIPKRLGVNIANINSDLAPYFGVQPDEGVLILRVDDDTMAEKMGLKAGDVIKEINGKSIDSAGDIRNALEDVDVGDEVQVTVVRNKETQTLKGEMQENESYRNLRNAFRWYGRGDAPHAPHMVMPRMQDNEELRKEIDQLREELDQLKQEMKKMNRR